MGTNEKNMTAGSPGKLIITFAIPLMLGNIFQQFYTMADTMIVGQVVGVEALAAVGAGDWLVWLVLGIMTGITQGFSILVSQYYGAGEKENLKCAVAKSYIMTALLSVIVLAVSEGAVYHVLLFLQTPDNVIDLTMLYLRLIFAGVPIIAAYNIFAAILRALGNSRSPLIAMTVAAVINVGLDLLFVLAFSWGVAGAAAATVLAQYVSGVGLFVYSLLRCREVLPRRCDFRFDRKILGEIGNLSFLTCLQQSAMNFGILLIQRLVDSFGPVTMAAFAAAVKIDTFAYLPVQDFGNAFSTFAAQNYGAGNKDRLRRGFRQATAVSAAFSAVISLLVFLLARPLMGIFIRPEETAVLSAGVRYLRIEGAFYVGIGCLFLLYGFYRAIKHPGMSVVLTVISLGTRVALAYALAGSVGETAIWAAIPIGWFLADAAGYGYYLLRRSRLLSPK